MQLRQELEEQPGHDCGADNVRYLLQQIAVLESMKVEHLFTAPHGGRVTMIAAGAGMTLMQDEAILYLEPAELDAVFVTVPPDRGVRAGSLVRPDACPGHSAR